MISFSFRLLIACFVSRLPVAFPHIYRFSGSPIRCLDFNDKYLVFGLYNSELNVLSYPFAKPDRFPYLAETCHIS